MESNEELKQLLDDVYFESLSLADTETLSLFKEAKEKLGTAKQTEEAYLRQQKEENAKLQEELEELQKQAKELEEQVLAQEAADIQRAQECRVGQQRVKELEEEYRSILGELKDMKESVEIHDGTMDDMLKTRMNPVHLQLAIYQGLGVTIKTDKHERATVACLTSSNQQKSQLISLNDDKPLLSTTNDIWNFIS